MFPKTSLLECIHTPYSVPHESNLPPQHSPKASSPKSHPPITVSPLLSVHRYLVSSNLPFRLIEFIILLLYFCYCVFLSSIPSTFLWDISVPGHRRILPTASGSRLGWVLLIPTSNNFFSLPFQHLFSAGWLYVRFNQEPGNHLFFQVIILLYFADWFLFN